MQLFRNFSSAEPEIAVGSAAAIVLEPLFVILERHGGFFLQWREFLFHLGRAVEQRGESFANKIVLRPASVRLLFLYECAASAEDSSAPARSPLGLLPCACANSECVVRPARNRAPQRIKAVSQTLIINKRIPVSLFQLFEPGNFVSILSLRIRKSILFAPVNFDTSLDCSESFAKLFLPVASSFARASAE